jgi:hypothetical protein
MPDYVELRGRGAFSFLETASLPEDLAAATLAPRINAPAWRVQLARRSNTFLRTLTLNSLEYAARISLKYQLSFGIREWQSFEKSVQF